MFVFSRFSRYFLEVARLGSIRKASEALHVSPSAIDRQILAAEEQLGVQLFERLPTGLKPTAAGELLLHSAGRWKREFERVQGQISDLVGLRRGHVRIAIIDALSKGFISRAIVKMRNDHPGVSVELSIMRNADIQGAIERGDVDFGILLAPRATKETIVQAVMHIKLGVVLPPEHELAKSDGLRYDQCVGHPVVSAGEPLALHDHIRALESSTGVELPAKIVSNNIQMIKSLVSDGAGLAVVTSLDVMDEVCSGELCFVPLTDKALRPIPLALCIGRSRQLSHAARLLLNQIERALIDVANA